jgi:hypothetical protein
MKELEMELRSWQPRRPSAKLERRLFASQPIEGATAQRVTHHQLPAFRLSWLAPATAALLLVCVLFNPRNTSTVAGSASPGPMVAMMMSNQSAAAFLSGNSQSEQNALRNTFERTNVSRYTPGIPPVIH